MTDSAQTQVQPLTPGQVLYQAEHDLLPFKKPSFRFAIFSSQRTGSNYLCRRLCNVKGRFGLPSEYLHRQAIQMMTPRLVPAAAAPGQIALGKFISALERVRTSEDGMFGIKVQPMQLLALVGRRPKAIMEFFNRFDRLILMTRSDKLGQAVSGAIAAQSGKWFGDGVDVPLNAVQRATLFPLVAKSLAQYIEEEKLILDVGKALNKPVLRIAYESVEADGPAVFSELTDFLVGGAPLELEESGDIAIPEKAPGQVAKLLREEFLRHIGAGDMMSPLDSGKPD